MATVTFPIELGGSGLVVSDDTDPTTGLRNGGYLTRFVPTLQQTVAVAGFVVGQVSNAAASASAAAGSASAASSSASSAASSAASAATLYDQFDDRYLGPKASNPTVDNDGNALLVGAMYFNTAALETRVWNGTTWQTASVNGGTVNSLIVTGALQYQGTLTGGTGVINIGSGQLVKDTVGHIGFGVNPNAWSGLVRAVQVANVASLSGRTGGSGVYLSDNLYFSGDPAGTASNGVYINSTFATAYQQFGGAHRWFNAPSGTAGNPITFTQAMMVTQGGNLLVGTTTDAGGRLVVNGGAATAIARFTGSVAGSTNVDFYNDQGGNSASNIGLRFFIGATNTASIISRNNAGPAPTLEFINNSIERARISSAGYVKASNTGSYIGNNATDLSTAAQHLFLNNAAAPVVVSSSTSTAVGSYCYVADLPTAAAGQLFRGTSNNTTVVYQVLANGNVQNTNNSYGAISDPKLKDIIGPKSSTWEKTKQYNWIEYYLKSDTEHTFKMLGLNAEEAAAISPGVVDESPDLVEVTKVRQVPVQIVRLDENESPVVDEETGEVIYDEVMVDEEYTEWEPNGEFTKSVKYSVVSMQYHRTTQECQQRIESLEAAKVQADDLIQQIIARVAALESASA
ncbi:hypothetical protein [Limnobacter alexandrii]|uniref:hypothetical protein n=1 Tax=Limnobacter alexandrii TaxID=2570352 RepID=UPI0011090A9C|nr:hypothetical protein [Limnobacter alexandrii]